MYMHIFIHHNYVHRPSFSHHTITSWIMENWRILNYGNLENLELLKSGELAHMPATSNQLTTSYWSTESLSYVVWLSSKYSIVYCQFAENQFKIWTHMGRVLLFEAKHCLKHLKDWLKTFDSLHDSAVRSRPALRS